ncbi:MAG: valine--tRNA ligase [Candidatus Gottesmanbacteria bacterium]
MDKVYNHKNTEERIYKMWEEDGYFTPKTDPKKKPARNASHSNAGGPFSVILPLPNANDPIHLGHAVFTVEDIMIRYHHMLGESTLWLPGADHAGIETQFVFEKKLAKEDKSRFDFSRDELYKKIEKYVEDNKDINRNQLQRMGFSLDWTRYHYSLEPEMVNKVFATFKRMHEDGLIYRGERIVNFCTRCGTAYSDLEIEYVERKDPLYYIKYGPFVLATTRPETKFGDTAVAFYPGDKRYQKYLDQEIEIKGVNGPFKVKVITDEAIDPKFGTGIEKVTPGHDTTDFEIGQRHNLAIKRVINFDGRLNELTGRFAGMKINQARLAVYEAMKEMDLIDHVDENYIHNVAICYKCGTVIEPMVMPQWFIRMASLAKPAIKAVKDGKTKIVPLKRFETMYFDWLNKIYDWNISRQIVWGPRIPVWYCLDCNQNILLNFLDNEGRKISGLYQDIKKDFDFNEIKTGLQSLMAPKDSSYSLDDQPCKKCRETHILQETDTFDTWFLSSQWPVNTLKSKPGDFEYFYPTSVLDTMWDILFFWVSRMMMVGIYLTGDVPFKTIHIHARVVDKEGKKMSKSKGNVLNPLDMVDKYGADALRMALIISVAPAGDIAVSEDKIRAMRNFTNKIWNAARFVLSSPTTAMSNQPSATNSDDKWILEELNKTINSVTDSIDKYRFGQAAEDLYEFFWHTFCDKYIEMTKKRQNEAQSTLVYVLETSLKLLHPFMPFITEEIYQLLPKHDKSIMISSWPNQK